VIPCNLDALSRYLDNELPLPQRVDLDRHLAECVRCARELEMYRHNDQVIRSWGRRVSIMPSRLEQRIVRDVGRRQRLGPLLALSRMMPAAVGTSAAALLVFVSATFGGLYANRGVAPQAAATPMKQTVVHQAARLIMNRRLQAIVGTGANTTVSNSSSRYQPIEN
jgi:anti-sigma factor RsiW